MKGTKQGKAFFALRPSPSSSREREGRVRFSRRESERICKSPEFRHRVERFALPPTLFLGQFLPLCPLGYSLAGGSFYGNL